MILPRLYELRPFCLLVITVCCSFHGATAANNRYGAGANAEFDSSIGGQQMRNEPPPAGNSHIFPDHPACYEKCELICVSAVLHLPNNETTVWLCHRLRPIRPSLLKFSSSNTTSIIMIGVGGLVILLVTCLVCCAIVNCCRASSGRGTAYLRGKEHNNLADEFIEVKPGQLSNGNGLLLNNGHLKPKRFSNHSLVSAPPKIDTISEV